MFSKKNIQKIRFICIRVLLVYLLANAFIYIFFEYKSFKILYSKKKIKKNVAEKYVRESHCVNYKKRYEYENILSLRDCITAEQAANSNPMNDVFEEVWKDSYLHSIFGSFEWVFNMVFNHLISWFLFLILVFFFISILLFLGCCLFLNYGNVKKIMSNDTDDFNNFLYNAKLLLKKSFSNENDDINMKKSKNKIKKYASEIK